MANTKSAEKRARQATARRARNVTQRSQVRTSIKQVVTAVQDGRLIQVEFISNVYYVDNIRLAVMETAYLPLLITGQ